ncbi:hypothetical protein [Oryza sativa Japonica Group]|uniref:Uncharacterized protein n=1 Tax=Oryza sativa subsp. japonica TaxID=39947 RepID=Q8LIU4_ORYSJ|nr:hypothetical protein [Oryza sativa Japonica Group]BAD68925.1 hypothetical protein [Oryza sativa Japonica Group]
MVLAENYHLAGSPTLALLDGCQVLSANRICAELLDLDAPSLACLCRLQFYTLTHWTGDSTISFGIDKKKKGKRKKTDVCSIALDEDQINVYQFGTLLNVDQLGGIVTCTIIPRDLIIN